MLLPTTLLLGAALFQADCLQICKNQARGRTNNVGHVAVEGLGDAGGVDAGDGVVGVSIDVLHTRLASAFATGPAVELLGLLCNVAAGLMVASTEQRVHGRGTIRAWTAHRVAALGGKTEQVHDHEQPGNALETY